MRAASCGIVMAGENILARAFANEIGGASSSVGGRGESGEEG